MKSYILKIIGQRLCPFFFTVSQADIKESGALTEQELSGAMRVVVGVMPKPEEASRIMRFFGEQRAEGKKWGKRGLKFRMK